MHNAYAENDTYETRWPNLHMLFVNSLLVFLLSVFLQKYVYKS